MSSRDYGLPNLASLCRHVSCGKTDCKHKQASKFDKLARCRGGGVGGWGDRGQNGRKVCLNIVLIPLFQTSLTGPLSLRCNDISPHLPFCTTTKYCIIYAIFKIWPLRRTRKPARGLGPARQWKECLIFSARFQGDGGTRAGRICGLGQDPNPRPTRQIMGRT